MGKNEEILNIVKLKGPILPVQVSKQVNDNILMTSARLSELLTNKQIKISHLKVGGSPLYYVTGQETKLQDYSDNIGGKEKEDYELLKEKKILRDTKLEPAIRVALRQIKDFALGLQVNYENKIELFWKWYSIPVEEAQNSIKQILTKKEEVVQENIINEETQTTIQEPDETPKETPRQEPFSKPEIKREISPIKENIKEKPKHETIKKEDIKQEQKPKKKKIDKELLLKQSNSFFDKNKIIVKETNEVKKNLEMDFVVELETTIGNVKYFCKSKNKKRIGDGDLGSALVQAQAKGLPLLFLTKGELTKAAKEMLESSTNNINFRKI